MGTRVYKFGLLPPTAGADVVDAELRNVHRYRNQLTEIENGAREYERSVYAELGDEAGIEAEFHAAKEAEEAAAREVKAHRAATRTRREDPAVRERLKVARDRLKRARAKRAEYWRMVRQDPRVAERVAAVRGHKEPCAGGEKPKRDNSKKNDGLLAQLTRSARGNSGVFWGTYLLAERAFGAAKAKLGALYDYKTGEPQNIRYARWTGEGQVGVQIQKTNPLNGEDLFGADSRVRVEPVDVKAWIAESRGDRRRASRTTLHLRVQSDDKRQPVWASWPMIMHRPVPVDAQVKWVSVSRRRIGPREVWSCEITVDEKPREEAAAPGVLAVRLGWRKHEDGGIVVAECLDTAGRRFDVRIPGDVRGETRTHHGVVASLDKADDIRAIRDKSFNAARDALCAWLESHDMPEWMLAMTVRRGSATPTKRQAVAYLSGWRSEARLASLARRWRENRWDGDAEGYDALEAWSYHDFHLWEWETSQRRKALRRRLDLYRNEAAKIAEKYGKVLFVDIDLSNVARRRPTEAEDGESETVRLLRSRAAGSELRGAIKNAVVLRNGKVGEEKAEHCKCSACGSENEAQRNKETGSFACVACPYKGDAVGVVLMNVLASAGHSADVRKMIERGRKAAEKIRTGASPLAAE